MIFEDRLSLCLISSVTAPPPLSYLSRSPPSNHAKSLNASAVVPNVVVWLCGMNVYMFDEPHSESVIRVFVPGLYPAIAWISANRGSYWPLTSRAVSYTHLRAHETDSYL